MLRQGLCIPYALTMSRYFSADIDGLETTLLQNFPKDNLLFVAIDCWSSTF
jgi:hypothetical protein